MPRWKRRSRARPTARRRRTPCRGRRAGRPRRRRPPTAERERCHADAERHGGRPRPGGSTRSTMQPSSGRAGSATRRASLTCAPPPATASRTTPTSRPGEVGLDVAALAEPQPAAEQPRSRCRRRGRRRRRRRGPPRTRRRSVHRPDRHPVVQRRPKPLQDGPGPAEAPRGSAAGRAARGTRRGPRRPEQREATPDRPDPESKASRGRVGAGARRVDVQPAVVRSTRQPPGRTHEPSSAPGTRGRRAASASRRRLVQRDAASGPRLVQERHHPQPGDVRAVTAT
jgi:hypothetical protein